MHYHTTFPCLMSTPSSSSRTSLSLASPFGQSSLAPSFVLFLAKPLRWVSFGVRGVRMGVAPGGEYPIHCVARPLRHKPADAGLCAGVRGIREMMRGLARLVVRPLRTRPADAGLAFGVTGSVPSSMFHLFLFGFCGMINKNRVFWFFHPRQLGRG